LRGATPAVEPASDEPGPGSDEREPGRDDPKSSFRPSPSLRSRRAATNLDPHSNQLVPFEARPASTRGGALAQTETPSAVFEILEPLRSTAINRVSQVPVIVPALLAPGLDSASQVRPKARAHAARWPVWRRVGVIVLPWLVLTIVYVPGALVFDSTSPQPVGWHYVVLNYLTCFMIWALCTPLIGLAWRRHPLSWPPQTGAALVHVGCALAMVSIHALLMTGFDQAWLPAAASHGLLRLFLIRMPFGVVLYTGTAACFAAADALRRYHQRERSLAQAQLETLKAQIEPHFLFNTLNAVSELVYRDPAAADRVITRLSALLRQLVERRAHEQSLREELAMLREYVSIQQTLLGARLGLHWQVPDELLEMQVPTLLLQPIYENAIRHGVAQLRQGGDVTLSVAARRGRLVVSVQNDGPALSGKVLVDGLGLGNTRARLQALYGSAQGLTLDCPETGGARVTIELPLHRGSRA
jgi:hypothetical protein